MTAVWTSFLGTRTPSVFSRKNTQIGAQNEKMVCESMRLSKVFDNLKGT
jgi:hypothetical protein